jgi:hypothetical protein
MAWEPRREMPGAGCGLSRNRSNPGNKGRAAGLPADGMGRVIANRSSRVYHRAGCPNAVKLAEKNRFVFGTADEAAAAGFQLGSVSK